MKRYNNFFEISEDLIGESLTSILRDKTDNVLENPCHGDFDNWALIIDSMPEIELGDVLFDADAVTAKSIVPLVQGQSDTLKKSLLKLHPWRKGPWQIFDIFIDTEWQSCMKWNRLRSKIANLEGKKVLDIGCGNGYYGFRMLAEGASLVVGIDPTLLFVAQFFAVNKYLRESRNAVLPLGIDDLPEEMGCFDTVFSMGVLYHRRDPVAHVRSLADTIVSGGQVVLETIVIDSEQDVLLIPEKRYAKMRNVWNLASPPMIKRWMKEAGLSDVEMVDIAPTTQQEQRKTDWMWFESLSDFLDPHDETKTIEGHPAPVRAVFTGYKA